MSRYSIRNNNKGAALILVIGTVALLSVIGALLLVKTANNREMKEREKKAQEAFYQAEGGTQVMVTTLETCAQNALKSAYVDMLLQYSVQTGENERTNRFAEYFQTALTSQLTSNAEQVIESAIGEGADIDLSSLSITMGTATLEGTATGTDTKVIRVPNVTFNYLDTATNTQSKLSTDILVQAKIPDINGSMAVGSVGSAFTDFALITDGNNGVGTSDSLGNQKAEIKGNLYVGGDFIVDKDTTIAVVEDAAKALVKGEIQVTNKGVFNILNSSTIGTAGQGVWAKGLLVKDGGKIDATSNFYVADDLEIEGNNSSVKMKGGAEYLGYNGVQGTLTDKSQGSSAITINTSSGITLDMSAMNRLVLLGYSYIYDLTGKWGAGSSATEGVLQGESVAYKDMQSMYLVPGDLLTTKTNPMTKQVYNNTPVGADGVTLMVAAADEDDTTGVWVHTAKDEDDNSYSFDYTPYLNKEQPYVARHVVLDGGATEFVYLYLNFKSEKAAADFATAFLGSGNQNHPLSKQIKRQIDNLGTSNIKLAGTNYTVANVMSYTVDDAGNKNFSVNGGQNTSTEVRLDCLAASQNYTGLFKTLSHDGVATVPVNSIVRDAVLVEGAFSAGKPGGDIGTTLTKVATCEGGAFYVVNGDLTINDGDEKKEFDGILLVNGKLTIDNGDTKVNGLVIATGGVEYKTGAKFTANQTLVEKLLEKDEVAKYFRGYSAGGNSSYLSTEAVTITFENWKKNE